MGNQLVGIAPSQILPVEHYLNEHPDLIFEKNLGSTRFFKVACAKSQEGLVVVKVFAIHDPSLPLAAHKLRVDQLKKILGSAVNCLPFQRAVLSDKAGFLIREYVKDSIYDRMSTRPFLLHIEKKWIAYQILNALAQCHKLGVCHGDIKLENICITSWNWVHLTDFASFKPTYLPEDNPADFSYFFDTSRRRICYIAPERFVKTLGADSGSHLLLSEDSMKKEELKPSMDIFSAGCSLAEMFAPDGQPPFDFSQLLAYRSGEYSPDEYLSKLEDENIHQLITSMLSKDPSLRLSAEQYLEQYKGKLFPDYFYTFLLSYNIIFSNTIPILSADEKLERMKAEISNVMKVIIEEDSKWKSQKVDLNDKDKNCDALVLIISMITSCIRGLHFAVSKIDALETLIKLAAKTTPEVTLDRILPYVMNLIRDPYTRVRVSAIHSLTTILSYLKSVPPSDANVFPEYILPDLAQIPLDDEVLVRAAFAENIAKLAEISLKLLEYCQVNQNETSRGSYESELAALHQMMQQMVSGLLTDSHNIVKQTLIENGITKLCVFFGKQKANDVLLSHMITFLNDKEDKQLRCSFFECIIGVAAYVGVHSSSILSPLLQQGITDSEEFVARKAINAITALTELSLLHKPAIYQLLDECAPCLVHPNLWVRQAVVGFVNALSKTLHIVDVHCKVASAIEPFLKCSPIQLDSTILVLNALKPCIPRNIYDAVIKYSEIPLLLQTLEERRNARNGIKRVTNPLPVSSQQTNSFCVWFNRLSSDGLTEDVEDLLFLMGEHLQKVHRYNSQEVKTNSNGKLDLTLVLKSGDFHSYPIKRNDTTKYEIYMPQLKRGNEDCILNMNEEWKTMFGKESNTTVKHEKTSSQSSDWNNRSSGSQSVMEHSIQERSYIQYRCAPSRLELRKLFKHRESLQGFWSSRSQVSGSVISQGWRLRPGLVSHLHAHANTVTRLLPIPDTTIMASCSYDGCVRIWDCGKMEGRNIANRARQVYNAHAGPLVGMTLCNANTCLGMASQSGSVVVLKFEANSNKMSVFATRQLDLDEEGSPIDITYFDNGSKSVLLYATTYGYLIGWDLRAPGIAWKFQNDIRQGVVTALHMDNVFKQRFLTLGTSSGHLTTWDLRFHIPISTIKHPGSSRIRKLCGHPKEPSCVIASSCGNNEVTIWNIESESRQTVFWGSPSPPLSSTNVQNSPSVCSMYSGVVEKGAFLLTGGTDHRIRYFDLDNYANSYVAIPAGGDVLGQVSCSYNCRLIDGIQVVHEIKSKINSRSAADSDSPRAGPDPPPVGHHTTITDLAIVSGTGGSLLASGASDGVIKVWK